jgi:hypothetical protein
LGQTDTLARSQRDLDAIGEAAAAEVVWVSSAGCLTPLHYDCTDGLLAQVLWPWALRSF